MPNSGKINFLYKNIFNKSKLSTTINIAWYLFRNDPTFALNSKKCNIRTLPNDGKSSRDVTATDSHRFDNIRNICTFENTKPFINNNLNRQQIVISSEPISRQFSHKKTSHEFQLSIEFENENRHSKKDRDYDTHTHTTRRRASEWH